MVAVPAFVVGAFFVDYQWAGVGVVIAAAVLAHNGGHLRGWWLFYVALLGLRWFNGNAWALLSLPLLWAFGKFPDSVPRHRWTFLGYHAAHLAVLAAISGGMDASGRSDRGSVTGVAASAGPAGTQVR